MGSSVGQEPKVLELITSWVMEYAKTPVLVKLTPNTGDILIPGQAAVDGGADGISLINTIKSIIGVNLDTLVPMPSVSGKSTNGGYCGPAVKPIALHMLSALAREPKITIPISGIGGVSTWQDAAEFLALGATSVQVCTAVMHHGYRIVEDLTDGLSNYLDDKAMKSVGELVGKASNNVTDWGDLDLNYGVIPKIDSDKCIGCQLCYIACLDGGHQCIHTRQNLCWSFHGESDHGVNPRIEPGPAVSHKTNGQPEYVPYVDEDECIGCNLCSLVCPVPGCITMEEIPHFKGKESWNERVAKGLG